MNPTDIAGNAEEEVSIVLLFSHCFNKQDESCVEKSHATTVTLAHPSDVAGTTERVMQNCAVCVFSGSS